MSNGSSSQPPLLSTLVNNTLVFCGLVVAGAMTFVASTSSSDANLYVLGFSTGAVVTGMLGGGAALLSNIYAHNLARRQEKHQTGQSTAKIDSARKWAAHWAETSFWIAIAAAAFAIALVVTFGIERTSNSTRFLTGLTISTPDGVNRISVRGPIRQVAVEDEENRCRLDIRTDTLSIRTDSANGCLVQRRP